MNFDLTLGQVKPYVYEDDYQYILDKHGLKDKEKQKITFFQILGQLSSWCVARLLIRNGYPTTGVRVVRKFTNITKTDDGYSICEIGCGFDCYLPYDERRDYLIKQMMKEEDDARVRVSGESPIEEAADIFETVLLRRLVDAQSG